MVSSTNTTSTPTNSLEQQNLANPTVLAQYKPRSQYKPQFGDYFVWSKWFTTWHGLIVNYDHETDELHIVVSGVPCILLTMPEEKQTKETIKVKLSDVKTAANGKFAILQHETSQNANVWYI